MRAARRTKGSSLDNSFYILAHFQYRDRATNEYEKKNLHLHPYLVSIYHHLQFAANYARDILVPNINKRVAQLKDIVAGKTRSDALPLEEEEENAEAAAKETKKTGEAPMERKKCLRKTVSSASSDDCVKKSQGGGVTDPELLNKLNSLPRPITREVENLCVSFSLPFQNRRSFSALTEYICI